MKIIKKKILNKILNYLKKNNPMISSTKDIPLNKYLFKLGYLDSMGIYNLVMYLEKNFKIKIEGEEIILEKFGTIKNIVGLVYGKIKKK